MEIDEKGRVNVSAKELLPKPEKEEKKENKKEGRKEPKKEENKEEAKEEKRFGEIRFFGKK